MKIHGLIQGLVLASSLAASSMALAHGSTAHQASKAIESAVEMFLTTQPVAILRGFQSVTANLTGHELFEVTIQLKNGGAQFKFNCHENEEVEPVVWECQAI